MTVRILIGHVLERLAEIPSDSVHCIVTSPPYWGLRSYGTEPQVWDAAQYCEHEWGDPLPPKPGRGNKPGDYSTSSLTNPARQDTVPRPKDGGAWCLRCGAWRGEHGLEPTLDLWLHHELVIWRELRRVLRKDGVAWCNIGDAYATSSNGRSAHDTKLIGNDDRTFRDKPFGTTSAKLKSKQRLMLPARLAIALQEDGWWLRDEIVWNKPNPMPISVEDRTTPAHEMVYMLTKRARYFFDQAAIMEPASPNTHARLSQPTVMSQKGGPKQDMYEADGVTPHSRRPNEIVQGLAAKARRNTDGTVWKSDGASSPKTVAAPEGRVGRVRNNPSWCEATSAGIVAERNKRSVWRIPTEPFPGAHFATMPTALALPCILASTSEKGCCPTCGAPWRRVTEHTNMVVREGPGRAGLQAAAENGTEHTAITGTMIAPATVTTLGWVPGCKCPAMPPIPATVLDPFFGSGTTGVVADRLGRDCIGIELKEQYAKLARERLADDAGMFAKIETA